MEEQEREITDMDPQECSATAENGVTLVVHHSRVHAPFSVVLATVLYCAELVTAAVLCSMYRKTDDVIWMSFTITFMLLPAVLIQLALTFIHRDLGRDRPLVLFLHLLLLGPVIRWVKLCKTMFTTVMDGLSFTQFVYLICNCEISTCIFYQYHSHEMVISRSYIYLKRNFISLTVFLVNTPPACVIS